MIQKNIKIMIDEFLTFIFETITNKIINQEQNEKKDINLTLKKF